MNTSGITARICSATPWFTRLLLTRRRRRKSKEPDASLMVQRVDDAKLKRLVRFLASRPLNYVIL